jgi:hypothetical protein
MTRARNDTLAADLENAIYRGLALLTDADKLTRQVARCEYDKLPFDEPLHKVQSLVAVAATVTELAGAILRKAALQEKRASIERTVRARMDEDKKADA